MSPLHPFERRLASTLRTLGFAGQAEPLLLAVSGGPDSTALLVALAALRERLNSRIHVLHVDHGLRPDSARDAAYVRRLCQRLGVPATIVKADVAGYRREHKLSVEEAARHVRYAALARVAIEIGARAVLTAHTADDQAETVLLHLLRGTGLRGLSGMAVSSPLPPTPGGPPPPPIPLVRPLLEATRAEVQAYLHERRLRPRQDPSNLSPAFLRNRLRHEILPLLEEVRPGATGALQHIAVAAAQATDYLSLVADQFWRVAGRKEGGFVYLQTKAFHALHLAVRLAFLQRAVREAAGDTEDFTGQHWAAMDRLLVKASPGRSLDLPRDLRLTLLYGEAALGRGEPPCPFPEVEETTLPIPGVARAGGWRVSASYASEGAVLLRADSGSGAPFEGRVAGVANEALFVRTWRPGDRLSFRGAEGHRKLQDLFTDAKVPRAWRPRLPVVVSPATGEVLWAAGMGKQRVQSPPAADSGGG